MTLKSKLEHIKTHHNILNITISTHFIGPDDKLHFIEFKPNGIVIDRDENHDNLPWQYYQRILDDFQDLFND